MLHSVVGSVTHPGDHNMDTDPSEQPLTGRRLPFGLAILAFIITPCPLDYSSQIFFFFKLTCCIFIFIQFKIFSFPFLFFGHEARTILLPQPGSKGRTLQWKHAVLPPDHQGSPSQILLYCSHIKYQPISPYLI